MQCAGYSSGVSVTTLLCSNLANGPSFCETLRTFLIPDSIASASFHSFTALEIFKILEIRDSLDDRIACRDVGY